MRALPKCHTEYFEVFSIVWRSFQCAAGLCVEKFPVCCWFVCGVVSLCASLKQHDDGPHADAAPRFLSYFQQRSENE